MKRENAFRNPFRVPLIALAFLSLSGLFCSLLEKGPSKSTEALARRVDDLCRDSPNRKYSPEKCRKVLADEQIEIDRFNEFYKCLDSKKGYDPNGSLQRCRAEWEVAVNREATQEADSAAREEATRFKLDVEATQAAVDAETQPAVTGDGDIALFCSTYGQMIDEIMVIGDEIEANQCEECSPNQEPYLRAEDTFERYFDLLVEPAPPEIRPVVAELAGMSMRGSVSTSEGLPEADRLGEELDAYVSEACGDSLPE